MRFCTQELNKIVRLIDGDIGRVDDFVCEAEDFFIREIDVHTGVWPFTKTYTLPPLAANFLKSDAEHLYVELSRDELKSSQRTEARRPVVREDMFALEEPWGMPFSWSREGLTPANASEDGPITSYHGDHEPPPTAVESEVPMYSCSEMTKSEVLLNDDLLGQVKDVVFEPALMQARYLIIGDLKDTSRKTDLLYPLEWVSEWSLEDRLLKLTDVAKLDLLSAPAYEREDIINAAYEDQICLHFNRKMSWRETPRLPRQSQRGHIRL